MSFKSVEQILKVVTSSPGWETYQQYCHLVECWRSLVSPSVLQHTRPMSISRQVLWVATSSAAWAQNMSLQRYSLLKKLNSMLDEPLVDLRFSSALWHNVPQFKTNGTQPHQAESQHPSQLLPELKNEKDASSKSVLHETSFERWLEKIRLRAQKLPCCPVCQALTPPGELARWNCCALCVTQPDRSEF